jgi:antitoxin ParD1/3/4
MLAKRLPFSHFFYNHHHFCKKYSYICSVKHTIMSRTVTASIGPHYEDFIRNSILSGRYNNASEVIREGLRRLEEDEARLAILKAAIDEGIASPDVEYFDPESFLQELKAKRQANR